MLGYYVIFNTYINCSQIAVISEITYFAQKYFYIAPWHKVLFLTNFRVLICTTVIKYANNQQAKIEHAEQTWGQRRSL